MKSNLTFSSLILGNQANQEVGCFMVEHQ